VCDTKYAIAPITAPSLGIGQVSDYQTKIYTMGVSGLALMH
jgi:hypothetical protein